MKRVDRENPIQRAIIAFLRAVIPGAVIHHSPNEIGLSGSDVARQIAKAKYNGMVPGFPDLVLAYPGGVAFLEVKSVSGSLTQAQKDVHAAMSGMGLNIAVVRSVDDVRGCLMAWGIPTIEARP